MMGVTNLEAVSCWRRGRRLDSSGELVEGRLLAWEGAGMLWRGGVVGGGRGSRWLGLVWCCGGEAGRMVLLLGLHIIGGEPIMYLIFWGENWLYISCRYVNHNAHIWNFFP